MKRVWPFLYRRLGCGRCLWAWGCAVDLFNQTSTLRPYFIDELDAVGIRGAGIGSGHDEREQTLNALLVEMDGFDTAPASSSWP